MATNQPQSFVAANLKNFRDRLAWTQAQLAAASGISERTVQRAEGGESVSAETLSALAGALNISLDDLRNAPKAEQELPAKYRVIKLARIARASDFRGLVPANGLQVGYDGLTEEQEDAVAELEQALRDLGDIWRDLEPVQQREALKDAHAHVAALEAMGLVVTAGTDLLRLKTDHGRPFSMEVLHVVVSSAGEPKLFALRDKTAPIRFT